MCNRETFPRFFFSLRLGCHRPPGNAGSTSEKQIFAWRKRKEKRAVEVGIRFGLKESRERPGRSIGRRIEISFVKNSNIVRSYSRCRRRTAYYNENGRSAAPSNTDYNNNNYNYKFGVRGTVREDATHNQSDRPRRHHRA